jgi:tetratricopeptide (TPR) repeat protein
LALRPASPASHIILGNALHDQKDLAGAIACYRRAVELDPKLALPHYNLGLALKMQKDLAGAIASYSRAIELDPKHAVAHNDLGLALHDQEDVLGAIASYRKAIDLDPTLAPAHYNLGNALREQKDLTGAVASYRKAIDIAPKSAQAHYGLGSALHDQKDLAGAIASLRKAIELDPKHAEAHCNLGHALRDQGEFTAALAALRTGHDLGSKRKDWPYQSATWVKVCERLVELDARLTDSLKGEGKHADVAERLEVAFFCGRHKKLCATSHRLYNEAFAADPKLAESGLAERGKHQHRYNAACYAALAAAGQGKDADKLDAAERPRLRRQALDWLRADLAFYARLLESGKPADHKLVAERMRHWQADSDFVSVRGAALDKLPDEERKAWQKLWADVADLLKKATAGK